jgi:hypothetical protein
VSRNGLGVWEDVIFTYNKMLTLGVVVDRFTYPSILHACSELSETAVGQEIEQCIRKCRYGLDVFVLNIVIY